MSRKEGQLQWEFGGLAIAGESVHFQKKANVLE